MGIAVTIEGVEKQTMVSSAAALNAAISNAKPGEVVTLDTVVTPFVLNITAAKRAPGICVVLPAGQTVNTVPNGQNLNTEVIGGRDSADVVNGNDTTNPAYSLNMNGSSFFARRGAVISQGSNCISGTAATDFEITHFVPEFGRGDVGQLIRCKRFLIDGSYGRDTAIKGYKMLWYTDSRAPVDGSADTSDGVTSFWVDTAHNDLFQIRNETGFADYTQDFAITNCDFTMLGAGLVAFGQVATGGQSWVRALLANNSIRTQDNSAIYATGDHIEVRDNIIGPHPTDPGTGGGTVNITLARNPANGKVRGGRNTFLGGSAPVNPAGVDLAGATITGDVVDPPALPNLRRLPWAPAVTRPTYQPYTAAPEMVQPPGIFYAGGSGGTAPVGTWITWGLGTVKGAEGATYQVRIKRNGTVISTSASVAGPADRKYQLQAGDTNITLEMRWTNANGTGAWRASDPVSAA